MYRIISFLALSILFSCTTPFKNRVPNSMNHDHSIDGAIEVCQQHGESLEVGTNQQAVIVALMQTREHRMQHALWHATRGGLTDKETTEVKNSFGSSWAKFHALCPPPKNNADDPKYNPAGEDFLFMHRGMIQMVRAELTKNSLQCIEGWKQIPTPKEWPLPDDNRSGAKSDAALAQLQRWDGKFQNRDWLKSVSLSQLGWALEFTIHNNLHMRYATEKPPKGFNGVAKTGGAPISLTGHFPANWKYDDARYNWLADPYCAALNPVFWKIHGYVDHLIDLWLDANDYKSIATDCHRVEKCYQWRGTWTGELQTPKALAKVGADIPSDDSDVKLNQKRMNHQHLGVLTSKDFGPPKKGIRIGESSPDDPVAFTEEKLCKQ